MRGHIGGSPPNVRGDAPAGTPDLLGEDATLACNTVVARDKDTDQPRDLAKSMTVDGQANPKSGS
jgi:hypothetical protein